MCPTNASMKSKHTIDKEYGEISSLEGMTLLC